MLELDIRELWYASSGVVYGRPSRIPTAESDGPLLPESHYAAAKLAGEAIISGFAHLYGWRALVFRFGNTVGPSSNHGVVHDFVVKLLRDPDALEILGDGTQAKPYVAVTDLVAGMRHGCRHACGRPVTVLNIGPEGTLRFATSPRSSSRLLTSAAAVEFAFKDGAVRRRRLAGRHRACRVRYGSDAFARLAAEHDCRGGRPSAAIGIAARYRIVGVPLLTAAERRAVSLRPSGRHLDDRTSLSVDLPARVFQRRDRRADRSAVLSVR